MEKATFFDQITERIEIDEANYVILKVPTYGEMQQVLRQTMKFSMKANDDDPSADVDIVEMEIASIVACIKDWGGPGFGGVTPSRESVLALPQNVIEKIKPHVDRLTSSKKSSKKNSTDTTK